MRPSHVLPVMTLLAVSAFGMACITTPEGDPDREALIALSESTAAGALNFLTNPASLDNAAERFINAVDAADEYLFFIYGTDPTDPTLAKYTYSDLIWSAIPDTAMGQMNLSIRRFVYLARIFINPDGSANGDITWEDAIGRLATNPNVPVSIAVAEDPNLLVRRSEIPNP